jgi:hypothetical protein
VTAEIPEKEENHGNPPFALCQKSGKWKLEVYQKTENEKTQEIWKTLKFLVC